MSNDNINTIVIVKWKYICGGGGAFNAVVGSTETHNNEIVSSLNKNLAHCKLTLTLLLYLVIFAKSRM